MTWANTCLPEYTTPPVEGADYPRKGILQPIRFNFSSAFHAVYTLPLDKAGFPCPDSSEMLFDGSIYYIKGPLVSPGHLLDRSR